MCAGPGGLMTQVRRPRQARTGAAADPARDDRAAIVHGLRRMVKALATYSQEVHRAYGLTGPQLWALKTLHARGPLAAGELAHALAVHQSSVSALVDRLEERRLVRRVRSAPDRRFVQVQLTPAGAELAAAAPEAAQGRLLHGLTAMPAAEVRRIRRAVETMVEAMEATDVEAPFFFADH